MNIHVRATAAEAERRERMFSGALHLDEPSPRLQALADHARSLSREFFAPLDPALAQFHLPVEVFAETAGRLKSAFTNDATTKELLVALLEEREFDLDQTYFDVPRLRVVTAGGYLRAGVGYAYRPHRDTWYAAPQCQINWWLPLADLCEEQALVFYPRFFSAAVANSSKQFDYGEWQTQGRPAAAQMIRADTRAHPLPLQPILSEDELRIITPAGHLLTFSAAQLHATAENTSDRTRFSIDFRTIHREDFRTGRGARNMDSAARGSTVTDFLRARDLRPFDHTEAVHVRA